MWQKEIGLSLLATNCSSYAAPTRQRSWRSDLSFGEKSSVLFAQPMAHRSRSLYVMIASSDRCLWMDGVMPFYILSAPKLYCKKSYGDDSSAFFTLSITSALSGDYSLKRSMSELCLYDGVCTWFCVSRCGLIWQWLVGWNGPFSDIIRLKIWRIYTEFWTSRRKRISFICRKPYTLANWHRRVAESGEGKFLPEAEGSKAGVKW